MAKGSWSLQWANGIYAISRSLSTGLSVVSLASWVTHTHTVYL